MRVDMVQKARRTQRSKTPTLDELGTTGLRHHGGFVAEEWLARLSGRRGAWAYREMADNDPVVGALLFAIEMLARGVPWDVEPGSDPRAAELVETCMDDMSGTWADFISEAFSKMTYGWAFHEIVYKRRLGADPGVDADGDPLPTSRYDDGLIGWRKLPIRAQETLERWVFAADGGIEAMAQTAYDGVRRIVPMEKALLFRTSTKRNNPEGRSILRNGYIPGWRKKNIEEIESIGIERDLAGIPMLTGPENVDLHARGNEHLLQAAQELVTSVRRDEDEGIVKNFGWEFELVTTGGSRQIDTDKTIRRLDLRIVSIVLADFILMAQDSQGSHALGAAKIRTFEQAMQTWLQADAEVLNRYAIPRLLKLNGMAVADPPRLVPGRVTREDVAALMGALETANHAGMPIDWSPELIAKIHELLGLPAPEESPVGETARGGAGAEAYDDKPGRETADEPPLDPAEIDPAGRVQGGR